jgi:hypothetical protein
MPPSGDVNTTAADGMETAKSLDLPLVGKKVGYKADFVQRRGEIFVKLIQKIILNKRKIKKLFL